MEVAERIRQNYPSMSRALKAFADFVLAEPVAAARVSIHAAVREAGVSVATANRFARAIGYQNYPAFRSALIESFAPAFEPVKRLEKEISRDSSPLDVVLGCLNEDIANLQRTILMMNDASCRAAVDMIVGSDRTLVIGFDNGGSLAQILANGLVQLKDHVSTVAMNGGGLGAARHLSLMGASDLVIAIAFPRYVKDTVRLAATAKEQGIPVLAITDSHRSPLAAQATLSLFADVRRQYASVSNAAALALIEALLAAASHGAPTSVQRAEAFTQLALPWIEHPGADTE